MPRADNVITRARDGRIWWQFKSLPEISDIVGISERKVLEIAKRDNMAFGLGDANYSQIHRNKELLHRLKIEKRLSVNEIADLLGSSRPTIEKWLSKYDIEPKDCNWSFEQGFTKASEKTKKWDGECRICGSTEEKLSEDRNLVSHHIIPRRAFDKEEKSHFPANLITLCDSCHRKVEKLTPRELFIMACENGSERII